jgi:RNA polymerase sigma-70 factor (ECF subfamily)
VDEQSLRARFDAGDLHAVATEVIRAYGPELYGFLCGMTRDPEAASEVFAAACERLWKGLPAFRWESPLRVWAYAIMRHQFLHWTRTRQKERRQVPLSEAPELAAVVEQVRTTTAAHLRSEVKDGFAKLRDALDPDDQLLLGLRLEHKMAWNDIARVLESGANAAALRKRFERLKTKLTALARDQGLVP